MGGREGVQLLFGHMFAGQASGGMACPAAAQSACALKIRVKSWGCWGMEEEEKDT